MKKNLIELPQETRKKYAEQIILFFKKEKDEEMGLIAAEKLLDFFIDMMGRDIYQKAIKDTNKLLKDKMDDLSIELDLLLDKR